MGHQRIRIRIFSAFSQFCFSKLHLDYAETFCLHFSLHFIIIVFIFFNIGLVFFIILNLCEREERNQNKNYIKPKYSEISIFNKFFNDIYVFFSSPLCPKQFPNFFINSSSSSQACF